MITTKKTLIAGLLIILMAPVFAQTKPTETAKPKAASAPEPAKDCYGEWYTLFRERGAKKIPDGTQEVVISIRKEGFSKCFMGKVDVENGRLVPPVYVAKQDGTFETLGQSGLKLDPASVAAKDPNALTTITDGMSITAYTDDHEVVKLFFYKYVNTAASMNKEAPAVKALVKN